jgi:putative membrane protein
MARAYMLFGFTVFLFQLHVSGNISKYINMKYSYLSLTAAILFAFLTVIQVIHVFKTQGNDEHAHDHDHNCDHTCSHGHVHKRPKGIKLFLSAIVFIFPVFTGLFLPISTLDSTIVNAKGFHFPVSEPGNNDPYMQRQYLKPDLSIYYGEEGYKDLIKQETKEFVNKDHIGLNDSNFLKGMEVLYDNPGIFLDKKITYKGFVYKEKSLKDNQIFLFRFGIIHCVADSGVYGMLIDFPKKTELKNDQWVELTGTIKQMYYQPFKTTIPYLQVDSLKEVQPPKEPYVYRNK